MLWKNLRMNQQIAFKFGVGETTVNYCEKIIKTL